MKMLLLSTFHVLNYINLKQIVLIQYIQCKGGSQAEVKRMLIVRHEFQKILGQEEVNCAVEKELYVANRSHIP